MDTDLRLNKYEKRNQHLVDVLLDCHNMNSNALICLNESINRNGENDKAAESAATTFYQLLDGSSQRGMQILQQIKSKYGSLKAFAEDFAPMHQMLVSSLIWEALASKVAMRRDPDESEDEEQQTISWENKIGYLTVKNDDSQDCLYVCLKEQK